MLKCKTIKKNLKILNCHKNKLNIRKILFSGTTLKFILVNILQIIEEKKILNKLIYLIYIVYSYNCTRAIIFNSKVKTPY